MKKGFTSATAKHPDGGDALTITVSVGADENVGAGPILELPVGCVCRIAVQVFINGQPAVVKSSTWTLHGTRIDWKKAQQGLGKTVVPLLEGPAKVKGGADEGDPASILAGWTGPVGGITIDVTGEATLGTKFYDFKGTGTVKLHVPSYTVREGPELGNPEISVFTFEDFGKGWNFGFDVREDAGLIWTIKRTDTLNGVLGFVQVMTRFNVTRTTTDGRYQVKGIHLGSQYPALDSHDRYFYDDQAEASQPGKAGIEDSPYEPLILESGGLTFRSYERDDQFTTFLAFLASKTGWIKEAYAVACAKVSWGWSAEADYNQDVGKFEIVGSPEGSLSPLEPIPWTPVEWKSKADAPEYNVWKSA